MNKVSAPGPDGLPKEFYIKCIEEIADLLTSLYNTGNRKGKTPELFYHATITLIHKRGSTHYTV